MTAEPNDRFAAHTRSASFALTLSAAQIQFLLAAVKIEELAAKYPWYRPHEANFGTAESLAVGWSTATVRSLARRGLLDVVPTPPPVCRHEVVQLTYAGRLLAKLLTEAAFEVTPQDVPSVPLHSDDRIMLAWVDGHLRQQGPTPVDRRDPADGPFLGTPLHRTTRTRRGADA